MLIKDFIANEGIKLSATRIDARPDQDDSEWSRDASHWRCVLTCEGRRMTVYFSQGSAHKSGPTTADVLDCLRSDALTYCNGRHGVATFEEWSSELDYSTDSRKAERTYRAVARQVKALQRIMGDDRFCKLLHEVEGL